MILAGGFYTCGACGAACRRKTEHACPGSLDDRIVRLESEVDHLRDEVAILAGRIVALESRR